MTTTKMIKAFSIVLIFTAGIFTLTSWNNDEVTRSEKQDLVASNVNSVISYADFSGDKCGTGKCGTDKKAKDSLKAKKAGKCGTGKCGADKKAAKKAGKCGDGKCGDGKCGTGKKAKDSAKAKKKAMKCGAGKCGGE